MKTSLFRLAGLLPAALLLAALVPSVASAHAFPKKSEPAAGATVTASPAEVKIWFTSYLEPLFNQLTVKTAAGRVVSKGAAKVDAKDPALLEVALPPLASGVYRVHWQVTAKDGHRTHGDFSFTVSGGH